MQPAGPEVDRKRVGEAGGARRLPVDDLPGRCDPALIDDTKLENRPPLPDVEAPDPVKGRIGGEVAVAHPVEQLPLRYGLVGVTK